MKFPVDLLAAVDPESLEQSGNEYMSELICRNPNMYDHLSLLDSKQVDIGPCNVSFVPIYGEDTNKKVLALFTPEDCFTTVGLYLLGQWWSVEDILKTADPSRTGLLKVQTPGERIVLYVLNRIIYRTKEKASDDVLFLCHGEQEFAKILWKDGEAIGFYSVKPEGSLCKSFLTQHYQLPVMDTMFVRKRHRGNGYGLQMLEDFVSTFKKDFLGLKYPLSMAMYKVCKKYISLFPKDKERLWEAMGVGGPFQRTQIAKKLHSMELEGTQVVSRLNFEDTVVQNKVEEKTIEYTETVEEEIVKINVMKEVQRTPVTAHGRSSDRKCRRLVEGTWEPIGKITRVEDIETEVRTAVNEPMHEDVKTSQNVKEAGLKEAEITVTQDVVTVLEATHQRHAEKEKPLIHEPEEHVVEVGNKPTTGPSVVISGETLAKVELIKMIPDTEIHYLKVNEETQTVQSFESNITLVDIQPLEIQEEVEVVKLITEIEEVTEKNEIAKDTKGEVEKEMSQGEVGEDANTARKGVSQQDATDLKTFIVDTEEISITETKSVSRSDQLSTATTQLKSSHIHKLPQLTSEPSPLEAEASKLKFRQCGDTVLKEGSGQEIDKENDKMENEEVGVVDIVRDPVSIQNTEVSSEDVLRQTDKENTLQAIAEEGESFKKGGEEITIEEICQEGAEKQKGSETENKEETLDLLDVEAAVTDERNHLTPMHMEGEVSPTPAVGNLKMTVSNDKDREIEPAETDKTEALEAEDISVMENLPDGVEKRDKNSNGTMAVGTVTLDANEVSELSVMEIEQTEHTQAEEESTSEKQEETKIQGENMEKSGIETTKEKDSDETENPDPSRSLAESQRSNDTTPLRRSTRIVNKPAESEMSKRFTRSSTKICKTSFKEMYVHQNTTEKQQEEQEMRREVICDPDIKEQKEVMESQIETELGDQVESKSVESIVENMCLVKDDCQDTKEDRSAFLLDIPSDEKELAVTELHDVHVIKDTEMEVEEKLSEQHDAKPSEEKEEEAATQVIPEENGNNAEVGQPDLKEKTCVEMVENENMDIEDLGDTENGNVVEIMVKTGECSTKGKEEIQDVSMESENDAANVPKLVITNADPTEVEQEDKSVTSTVQEVPVNEDVEHKDINKSSQTNYKEKHSDVQTELDEDEDLVKISTQAERCETAFLTPLRRSRRLQDPPAEIELTKRVLRSSSKTTPKKDTYNQPKAGCSKRHSKMQNKIQHTVENISTEKHGLEEESDDDLKIQENKMEETPSGNEIQEDNRDEIVTVEHKVAPNDPIQSEAATLPTSEEEKSATDPDVAEAVKRDETETQDKLQEQSTAETEEGDEEEAVTEIIPGEVSQNDEEGSVVLKMQKTSVLLVDFNTATLRQAFNSEISTKTSQEEEHQEADKLEGTTWCMEESKTEEEGMKLAESQTDQFEKGQADGERLETTEGETIMRDEAKEGTVNATSEEKEETCEKIQREKHALKADEERVTEETQSVIEEMKDIPQRIQREQISDTQMEEDHGIFITSQKDTVEEEREEENRMDNCAQGKINFEKICTEDQSKQDISTEDPEPKEASAEAACVEKSGHDTDVEICSKAPNQAVGKPNEEHEEKEEEEEPNRKITFENDGQQVEQATPAVTKQNAAVVLVNFNKVQPDGDESHTEIANFQEEEGLNTTGNANEGNICAEMEQEESGTVNLEEQTVAITVDSTLNVEHEERKDVMTDEKLKDDKRGNSKLEDSTPSQTKEMAKNEQYQNDQTPGPGRVQKSSPEEEEDDAPFSRHLRRRTVTVKSSTQNKSKRLQKLQVQEDAKQTEAKEINKKIEVASDKVVSTETETSATKEETVTKKESAVVGHKSNQNQVISLVSDNMAQEKVKDIPTSTSGNELEEDIMQAERKASEVERLKGVTKHDQEISEEESSDEEEVLFITRNLRRRTIIVETPLRSHSKRLYKEVVETQVEKRESQDKRQGETSGVTGTNSNEIEDVQVASEEEEEEEEEEGKGISVKPKSKNITKSDTELTTNGRNDTMVESKGEKVKERAGVNEIYEKSDQEIQAHDEDLTEDTLEGSKCDKPETEQEGHAIKDQENGQQGNVLDKVVEQLPVEMSKGECTISKKEQLEVKGKKGKSSTTKCVDIEGVEIEKMTLRKRTAIIKTSSGRKSKRFHKQDDDEPCAQGDVEQAKDETGHALEGKEDTQLKQGEDQAEENTEASQTLDEKFTLELDVEDENNGSVDIQGMKHMDITFEGCPEGESEDHNADEQKEPAVNRKRVPKAKSATEAQDSTSYDLDRLVTVAVNQIAEKSEEKESHRKRKNTDEPMSSEGKKPYIL